MKKNFSELDEFNNETLLKAMVWGNRGVALKNAIKKDDYLVIDWKGVKVDEVNLDNIDIDVLIEYMDGDTLVNNKDVSLKIYKKLCSNNDELLWVLLVDCHRFISDEFFQMNTTDENLEILWKVISTRTILPL